MDEPIHVALMVDENGIQPVRFREDGTLIREDDEHGLGPRLQPIRECELTESAKEKLLEKRQAQKRPGKVPDLDNPKIRKTVLLSADNIRHLNGLMAALQNWEDLDAERWWKAWADKKPGEQAPLAPRVTLSDAITYLVESDRRIARLTGRDEWANGKRDERND